MKNLNLKPYIFILSSFILITSCSKDAEIEYITETVTVTEFVPQVTTEIVTVTNTVTQSVTVEVPYSYEFARAGKSTVSFSGQTARLNMADELYSALNTNTFTKAQMLEMFNDGNGFAG
jgi:urocanate hydratase